MNVEVISDRASLPGLAARWDELALADPRDGFFRSFGWYRAWIDHIRPDVEPYVVVARDEAGAIVGLAPLCRGIYRDLGLRLKAVFWAGREVVSGDFLDFLAVPELRANAISAILEFLMRNASQWSVLVLGELVVGADSFTALEDLASRHGLQFRRQEDRVCPYIALPGSFDEYLAGLGSSTRYHIRRRMRDVEKQGAKVEVYSEPEQVVQHLDTLIRLHLARWQKENLPGTMGRPGFADFLREICRNPPYHSRCRLYLLTLAGAPAAALMTFQFGESALYYQAGWDPDSPLAAFSPAVVLMASSIRDAIQQGLHYYEFLRGDEAYKSRWSRTCRTTATVLLAGQFAGKEYLRLTRWKDLVKNQLSRQRGRPAAQPLCSDACGNSQI